MTIVFIPYNVLSDNQYNIWTKRHPFQNGYPLLIKYNFHNMCRDVDRWVLLICTYLLSTLKANVKALEMLGLLMNVDMLDKNTLLGPDILFGYLLGNTSTI